MRIRRELFTPRWLMRHAIVVFLLAAFAVLAYWQAVRAGQGNARSYAYAVEWPIFGIFIVYVWWKTIKDELDPAERARRPIVRRSERGRVGVSTDLSTIDDSGDPEVAAYNRYLARLNKDEQ